MSAGALSPAADPADLSAHALPEGVILFERYRVGRRLASGAVAVVYVADDLVLEQRVALKVFDPLRSADPLSRARFAREFQILTAFDHPGVARALRFEEDPRFDVLVMELVEGDSLRARFERGRLDWAEAVALGRGLVDALEACHAAGVVHRDLKPENVVLHPERGPVILDFGVAWFSSALTLTRTGAIIGSPRYLAPELFRSPDVDPRADVFSLGAILYEALAGRPVRDAESMAELAAQDGPERPPPLAALRPDLPGGAAAILERALAHRPEHRYASAAELGEALAGEGRSLGRRLETRLTCSACETPLVLDLPICPGCGVRADWTLDAGSFAVQILEVDNPRTAATWLRRRYPEQLVAPRWLERRLGNPPVPLAVGVSERTAESLVAQARDAGCRAEILRARAVLGPALRVPSASPAEILGAAGLHFSAVMAAGLAISLVGGPGTLLFALPAALGVAGVGAAARYARRPLLEVRPEAADGATRAALEEVRDALAKLETTRARRLAAAAVARATPALIDGAGGTSREVQEALRRALERVKAVDRYALSLRARSRAKLRAALASAERAGDEAAVQALEAEIDALTQAGVAHDLAVRDALEGCREISAAWSE